ncbi:unnamed protein product, partial [Arabidopsis lyrata]
GFDFGCSSSEFKIVRPRLRDDYDHLTLYARLGLYCYNFHKGTSLKFVRWENDAGCTDDDTYVVDTWRIFACRPTCNKPVDDYWDRDEEIVPFYTGEMPKWLSDEALTSDNKKYYVVQESELHENEWLHLFIEIAFYSKAKTNPELVEINKVVVETKEDYISEAREKLHAENAIFYISYKYTGVSSSGLAGDHKAIIRKTMDGITEHMSLEVASEHG